MSVQYTYCASNRTYGYGPTFMTPKKTESSQNRAILSTCSTKSSSMASTPDYSKQNRASPRSAPFKVQFLPEKSQKHQGMNTLVLDMDETLLHASTVSTIKPDFIARFSDGSRYYVLKRPHVDEFLERMSKLYEIVIYTAGEREYATTLINLLDPKRYISYILHRGHCINTRNGMDKDLSLIGRDLKSVIFIDNLEENLKRQRENGIKILDFYSNRRDEELKKLIPFLEYAATLDEVRPINKLYSDFLVNGLRKAETPKFKIVPPQNQTANPQRRRSIFEESPKVSGKDKLNASMTDFSKVLNLTPIQEQSTTISLNDLSVTSTPYTTSRMQPVISTRLTPSNGDVNTPLNRISLEGERNSFSSFISKEIPQKRVVLEKETLTYKRETEQGNLISSSAPNTDHGHMFKSSQKLVCNLVDRINALEQKLKTSQVHRKVD